MAAVVKENTSETVHSETYETLMQVRGTSTTRPGREARRSLPARQRKSVERRGAGLGYAHRSVQPHHCPGAQPVRAHAVLSEAVQQAAGNLLAHSTAQMLSQFLHGEQGALLTAATVAHGVPDMKAKYYAATQTIDEARHVEAYDRYVNKIAIHYPMVPWLKLLIDTTLQTNNFCKVMIGMNMIIEGLRSGRLQQHVQADRRAAAEIHHLQRDARRVAPRLLRPRLPGTHGCGDAPDEREDLAQFAFDAVEISGRPGPAYREPVPARCCEVSEIDPHDFMAGIKEAAELGITGDLPPGRSTR